MDFRLSIAKNENSGSGKDPERAYMDCTFISP